MNTPAPIRQPQKKRARKKPKHLWFKNNGLSIVLLSVFAVCLIGQSMAGFAVKNDELRDHHMTQLTFNQYLLSGHFLEATFENWESEFLQMGALVVLTIFFRQRGSAESKPPEESPGNEQCHKTQNAVLPAIARGGLMRAVYENSLSIALFSLFLFSFVGHVLAGAEQYNEQRTMDHKKPLSITEYMGSSQLWFESLQNWQSEFLSTGALIILTIWLRQKGSSQSKPIGSSDESTGPE